jgi:cell wall assembly regulator SMI1
VVSRDRIPQAANGGGACLCVDTKPLKKETVGQTISVGHKTPDRGRVTLSPQDFLMKLESRYV